MDILLKVVKFVLEAGSKRVAKLRRNGILEAALAAEKFSPGGVKGASGSGS